MVREFKSRTGGTIRIMDDYMARTPQEKQKREQATMRACCEVLANAAEMIGVEATLQLMKNGPHSCLLEG